MLPPSPTAYALDCRHAAGIIRGCCQARPSPPPLLGSDLGRSGESASSNAATFALQLPARVGDVVLTDQDDDPSSEDTDYSEDIPSSSISRTFTRHISWSRVLRLRPDLGNMAFRFLHGWLSPDMDFLAFPATQQKLALVKYVETLEELEFENVWSSVLTNPERPRPSEELRRQVAQMRANGPFSIWHYCHQVSVHQRSTGPPLDVSSSTAVAPPLTNRAEPGKGKGIVVADPGCPFGAGPSSIGAALDGLIAPSNECLLQARPKPCAVWASAQGNNQEGGITF